MPTALVVGTVLSVVSQGAALIAGHLAAAPWGRIAVNYLVPFCVASIGYLCARHAHR